MAITVLQQPTTPNVTGTQLIYCISSSNIPQYQFRYIADLYYSGSTDKLSRFKYPANGSGTCNIALQRPIKDYLGYDYNWKISDVQEITTSSKEFEIKFGEEFGTSYSSSVNVFTNQASASIQAFKGAVYPSQTSNGFNWTSQPILTNSPVTQSFDTDNYLTATVYDTNATVKYYQTGSLTATKNYVSAGKFSAVPISPLNVSNYTNSDAITLDVTGSSIRYEVNNDCRNDRHRIAFVNKFGFFDYYTCNTALRRVTNIDRKTYEQSFVDLNDRIATYDSANRGEEQYYTEYTDEFEFTTDSITSEDSQWLREMFQSSEVFTQSGSNMIPINILNSRETILNDTARNKNYQYTVRYQFSNLREPR